jgi:hypothetical protein
VNIDSVLGQCGDKPLVAHGVSLSDKLRQRRLAILKKQISSTATQQHVDTLNEDAYSALVNALSCNLEQQAAYTTKTPERYKRRVEQMIIELELFTGTRSKRYPCYFFEMIKEWISKAQEFTRKTEPMEAEATNTTQDAQVSPAVATAARRAATMDFTPTTPTPSSPPQPPSANKTEPNLSYEELDALQPCSSPSRDLQVIGHTTRLQQISLLYKRLKRTNRIAASRLKERLTPAEVVELTHTLESKILKEMDRDMIKLSRPPSERQSAEIHVEYCKRVNSKVEEYSILKTFLSKVRIFHTRVASVIRQARKKIAYKFSRVYDKEMSDAPPAFGQSSQQHSTDQQSPGIDSGYQTLPEDPREDCIRHLIRAILSRNIPLSYSLNGGNCILTLNEVRDVAKMLETDMAGIMSNKLLNVNMNYDEQLQEYSTLGRRYIDHVQTDAGFVEAVQMYRNSHPHV